MKGVIQTKIRGKIGAVIVLGIFTALILAQSVAADDYDTDGDGYVGNGGEERIFFDDDTAEIEMLDANVGIGTTSPDNLLDIEKSGTAKSNLDIFHITNNVNAADMDGTETSILFNQWYYDVSTPAVADAGRITVGTETDWTSTASTQDGYMSFHTVKDGTVSEQARITSDGKVGIGTTGPDARLDILDTSGAQLRLTHTDGTKFCDFQVDSVHDLTIRPSSDGQIKLIPTTNSRDFFQVWNAAQTTPVLNVDTVNYRVGIGVSTFPQNTLDVEGAVAIGATYSGTSSAPSNGAIIEGNVGIGTASPNHKLEISDSDTTANRAGLYVAQSGVMSGTNRGYGIYVTKSGVSLTATNVAGYFSAVGAANNYGLIVENGDVGIGTASPQGALDVVSTTGGLIVPRMTTAQRNALTAVNGMIIYNTDTPAFNFFENGIWVTGSGLT